MPGRPDNIEPIASRKAFTLIELLVVIAIVSLLVSILLPSLQTARYLAKRLLCSTQIRATGNAYVMYAEDNSGELPAFRVLFHYYAYRTNGIYGAPVLYAFLHSEGVYSQYLDNPVYFYCPLDETYTPNMKAYFASVGSPRWSYWCQLGVKLDTLTSDFPMQWDRGDMNIMGSSVHGTERNILYGDGHVENEYDIAE